jgi:plastocyanin
MSNETLFYICGVALTVSAVVASFIGLRVRSFPGKAAPLVALWFVILIGGTTTFAVLHAKDEEDAKATELSKATEEIEEESLPEESGGGGGAKEGGEAAGGGPSAAKEPGGSTAAGGAGGTLQLAASPTQIAFDKTELTSKPGKVTIDFINPAAIEHDVAIEQGAEEIAKSALITEGKTSVSADLEPGTYTFLCTVPGHAEAGMEGTLTVK